MSRRDGLAQPVAGLNNGQIMTDEGVFRKPAGKQSAEDLNDMKELLTFSPSRVIFSIQTGSFQRLNVSIFFLFLSGMLVKLSNKLAHVLFCSLLTPASSSPGKTPTWRSTSPRTAMQTSSLTITPESC